jgi:DNA-binding CsgD family transcriptional regulator
MLDGEFARLEYATQDINQFYDINIRETPVGVLERDTAGHPDRCVRYRDFLVPNFDHGHELRAAFRSRHGVWGVIGVYRPVGRSGFTDEEAAFIASVSGTVAEGFGAVATRRAVTTAAPNGPAVVTLGPDNRPLGVTPTLEQYAAQLGPDEGGELPMPVLSIAAAVRARGRGLPAPEPRVTVRARSGEWLMLAGAPLSTTQSGDADVVVTIDHARPPDIVSVVMAALGLTRRERDVVALVLGGQSTNEIGRRLHISAYTVQDHLRSIFDKAGVRSRRQLVASMFFEHYAPRLGQSLDHRGWFAA